MAPRKDEKPKIDQGLDAIKGTIHHFAETHGVNDFIDSAKKFTGKRIKSYGICAASAFVMFHLAFPLSYTLGVLTIVGAVNLYSGGSKSLAYRVGKAVVDSWTTLVSDAWKVATLPVRPLIWGAKKMLARTGVAPAQAQAGAETSPATFRQAPQAASQTFSNPASPGTAFSDVSRKPANANTAPGTSSPAPRQSGPASSGPSR